MSDMPVQRETANIARSFLLQAVGLFIAMLLPYAILGGFSAPFGSFAIMAAYVVGASYLIDRHQKEANRKGASKPYDKKTFVSFLLYLGGGFLAVSGIIGSVIVLWLGLAYTGGAGDPVPLGEFWLGALGHMLTLLAGAAVALALSVVLLHWGRGGPGALARRVQRRGVGLFLAPWLSEIAMLALYIGGSTMLAVPAILETLLEEMSFGRRTLFFDGFGVFPFLPLGILATAVLAVAHVSLNTGYHTFNEVVRALREDEAEPPAPDGWWPALVAIILSASSAMVVSLLWCFHMVIVAGTASAPAMQAGFLTVGAVDDWSAKQVAAGRSIAEIAATINHGGHWSTAAPGRGLPELLPGLGADFAELELQRDCRIVVAAAPMDQGELDIEWPVKTGWEGRSGANSEARDAAEIGKPYEPPSVRYCVKASCASPVTWNASPAIFLYSSHPTANINWTWLMYVDLLAEGTAPEPGGYCNADGTLADTYQG